MSWELVLRFADNDLQKALDGWRNSPDIKERAMADNFWFESRVSDARQQIFETYARASADPAKLKARHNDYYGAHVVVDEHIPHTFLPTLSPASFGDIDDNYTIVRIECIDGR
ncbi:MAG: hypothetical protein H7Y60_02670 [Rhodospirillaceae bacterium]|nr:hypothetical protein [Rhodospirillales bacterium]